MNSLKSFFNVAGLFVLASQSFSIAHAQNLLVNGGFESGAVVSGNATDIDTWGRAGTQTGYIGDATYVPREGTRLALFNAGGDSFTGALSQSFTTVPGQNYTVSVDVGIVGATGKSQRLGVIVNGTAPNLVADVVTVAGPTKWVTQTYSFTADGTSATLLLSDQSAGLTFSQRTSADLVVDKVSVTLDTGGNASPVAVADTYSTDEDTPLVVNAASGLLANDTDGESDPLDAIKVTDPANGSVALNDNGSFTYTPNSNFAGTDSFTYKANDGTSDSNVVSVTLTVNAVNDAPVAVADSYVVTEDTPLLIPAPGLLANDTDVEGSSLTPSEVTGPSNGSLTLNTDGSFTYTPITGYTGADSFTYKVSDGTADSAPVAVSLTVQAPAPVGLLNGSFEDGTPQNVGPLDNWTITGSSGPSGTPPFAPFGYLTSAPFYVPRDGNRLVVFNAGSNTFDGKITQTFGTVIGETYEVRFSAAIYNASGTTSPTARTQKVRLTVKGNGGATLLTVTEDVSGPRNATTWREDILHTFVADSATTEISFDDNVTIAGATTTGATTSDLLLDHVRVTAAGSGNAAPVAVADAYSTNEDTPLTVAVGSGLLLNDTDSDTDPLTASKVTDPANGTVTVNSDGSFSYTPNANFNGTDTFTYKANDGLADSSPATVTLTVNAVNDAPVAVADSYNVTQDTQLLIAEPGVLANDTDVENGALNAIEVTAPTNGTLTLDSDGGFTYIPNTGYTGADSFTYKANDGSLDSSPVTVSLTVQAPAPVGLLNGSFEDGTPQNVGPLDNWTITGTAGAPGNPPFPPFGFLTSAPFYVPRDGNRLVVFNAGSNTFDGKVSQTFGTVIGQTYEVRFSAAIYNASGTTSPTSRTQKVRVIVKGNGGSTLLTATEDVSGPRNATTWRENILHTFVADSATTEISFDDGATLAGTAATQASTSDLLLDHVRVTAAGVGNTAPVAVADSYSTDEDTPLTVAVGTGLLANDTDAELNPLTAAKVTDPANGTVTLNSNGSFTYTPNANFNGSDSFTYKASDGVADSNVATVSLTIAAANDAPVAVADSYTATQDNPLVVAAPGVLANDTDAENSALTAIQITGPANGSLTLNSNGGFTYTPNSGYAGADSFTYKANDGLLDSTPATVSITVEAAVGNVLVNGSFETGTVTNSPFAGASNIDGWTLGGTGTRTGYVADATWGATDGSRLVIFNAGGDSFGGQISQTFTTVVGQLYTLSLDYGIYSPSANKTQRIGIVVSGVSPSLVQTFRDITSVANTSRYLPASFQFTADSTSTTLTLADLSGALSAAARTGGDLILDNVKVEPVITRTLTVNSSPNAGIAIGVSPNDLSGNSNGTTSFTRSYLNNASVTLTAPASSGTFLFSKWQRNGIDLTTSATAVVTVSSNQTLTAVYEQSTVPIASGDSYTTNEDTELVVSAPGVLANDLDPNSLPLTAVLNTPPATGTLVLNPDGSFSYTPVADANGPVSFTYHATNGTQSSSPVTVNITVTPTNDAPVAIAQTLETDEDTALPVVLTSTDIDGDLITYVISTPPSNGVLSGTAPNLTYTPNANYQGADSFAFTAGDGSATSAPATVSINVISVPDAPIANAQSLSLRAGTSLPITLTGTDGDGDPITFNIVSSPTQGALSGTIPNLIYIPVETYVGSDSFTFTVSDGTSTSAPATISITVDSHVLNPSFELVSGTDPNFTPNSWTATGNYQIKTTPTIPRPGNGLRQVAFNTGNATPNAVLSQVFPTVANRAHKIQFDIGMQTFVSSSRQLKLRVRLFSGAIVHFNQEVTITRTGNTTTGVVGWDLDKEFNFTPTTANTTLEITDTSTSTAANGTDLLFDNVRIVPQVTRQLDVVSSPNTGVAVTVTPNDINATGNGVTSFTRRYLNGASVTLSAPTTAGAFNFQKWQKNGVDDGTNPSGKIVAMNENIVMTAVYVPNAPPVTLADSFTTDEDTPLVVPATGVLGNDSDPELQSISATIQDLPVSGTVLLDSDGGFTYTPSADFNGSDSFTYVASDGVVSSEPTTVTITVNSVNDLPVADPQNLTLDEDTSLPVTLTGSDVETAELTYEVVTGPSNGVLSGTAPNLTYTPNENFFGTDSFTFKANDGTVDSPTETVSLSINPMNDAPTASSQSVTLDEDAPQAINLVASDIDGNPLTYIVGDPANGTLSGVAPALVYTPNENYSGSDSFTFKVSDGTLESNLAVVSIEVEPIDDAPVATPQTLTVNEDTALPILLGGTDVESPTVTVEVLSQPISGSLTGVAPNLVYTPDQDFVGTDSFTFRVNDGLLDSPVATVDIEVVSVNDAPIAIGDLVDVVEDTPTGIFLMTDDVDGDILDFTISDPEHGSLSGTAPNLTYTPDLNYTGNDSFTFKVSDGEFESSTVTVEITVTPVDDAPIATNQNVEVDEDQALNITIAGTDVESPTVTTEVLTQPASGTLSGTAPNLTYTPNANFSGTDSFTFKVNDGLLDSEPGTVSILVEAVNDAPTAAAQIVAVNEDTPKAVNLVANDIDGDELTYIVGNPSHGTLSGTAPNLIYSPVVNYTGPDSFTFKVSDGSLESALVEVTIDVAPINDLPTATPQTLTTAEDTALGITLGGLDEESPTVSTIVLANPSNGSLSGIAPNIVYTPGLNFVGTDSFTFKVNDGEQDSEPATVTINVTPVNDPPAVSADDVDVTEDTPTPINLFAMDVDSPSITYIVGTPSHGTLSGEAPALVYTPTGNYTGPDSFTVKASDGELESAEVLISIEVLPVNDAPIATPQSLTTDEDVAIVGILLAGTDVDLDELNAMVVDQPENGTLTGTVPNLTYTPNENFSGTDAFTFKVSDGQVDSAVATIAINVTAVNDLPIATAQTLDTDEDTALNITLAGADVESPTVTTEVLTQPTNGTLTGTAPDLTYTPNLNFSGTDSFTFRVNDGTENSTAATITINVAAVNDLPTATAQTLDTDEDTALNITLAGVDVESPTVTTEVLTQPTSGTLTGTAPELTYTPNLNFSGTDSFTFRVNDGTENSTAATITINVAAVNDLPIATAQTLDTDEDTALNITLAGTDVESPTVTTEVLTQPTSGTLTGTAPELTYTPNLNFSGTDSFTFRVNDGTADSAAATITINVAAVNDLPIATAQTLDTDEDTALNITLEGTDVESPTVTTEVLTQPTSGTLTGTAPELTYTPNLNFTGTDSFTFRVNDGTADSTAAMITINVAAVNDLPTATAQTLDTDEDTALNITLAGTDVESPTVTTEVLTQPTNGTLTGIAPELTYTPNLNFTGTDSFTFKVNDGTADSTAATITINVAAVNDLPTATAQTLDTDEDTALNITLAGTDVESPTVTTEVLTQPTNGTLTGTAPELTYTPNLNFTGTDSFTFRVNDGTENSTAAMVTINVAAVNDLPTATAQTLDTDEDTALNITLAGTDVESPTVTTEVLTQPTNGTLTGTAPELTYTPNLNFSGTDSFNFRVNDGTADSTAATITINVAAVNDAPTASSATVEATEDTPQAITLAAADIEGSSLTYTVGNPSNGTLTGTAPDLTYTPNANFFGSDSFTFEVSDGLLDSNEATITINVSAVNDVPVATAQSVSVDEDSSVAITLAGTDVEGSILSFTVSTPPTNGSLSGTAPNLTYTPNVGYFGPDSFGFTAGDGSAISPEALVTITVNEVADAGFAAWLAEFGLIAGPNQDSDNDGISNAVEYVIGGNPASRNDSNLLPATTHVTADPDQNSVNEPYLLYTYRRTDRAKNDPLTTIHVEWNNSLFGAWTNTTGTPGVVTTEENDHYGAGIDRVRVYIPKSLGTMLFARLGVFINVAPANQAPVANPQSVSLNEDGTLPITLTATDANLDTLTYSIVTQPTNGTLSGTPPNVTYTPFANYSGPDSFTFKANDTIADSALATVSITVNPQAEITQWLASYGITASMSVDSDNDSISNMLEWVLGGNPATASIGGLLPTSQLVSADLDNNTVPEQYLLFTYRRADLANSDPATVIRVEWDADMSGTWTNASGTLGVSTFVDDDAFATGVDRVRVYIPRSLAPSGKIFARLAVTVNN